MRKTKEEFAVRLYNFWLEEQAQKNLCRKYYFD